MRAYLAYTDLAEPNDSSEASYLLRSLSLIRGYSNTSVLISEFGGRNYWLKKERLRLACPTEKKFPIGTLVRYTGKDSKLELRVGIIVERMVDSINRDDFVLGVSFWMLGMGPRFSLEDSISEFGLPYHLSSRDFEEVDDLGELSRASILIADPNKVLKSIDQLTDEGANTATEAQVMVERNSDPASVLLELGRKLNVPIGIRIGDFIIHTIEELKAKVNTLTEEELEARTYRSSMGTVVLPKRESRLPDPSGNHKMMFIDEQPTHSFSRDTMYTGFDTQGVRREGRFVAVSGETVSIYDDIKCQEYLVTLDSIEECSEFWNGLMEKLYEKPSSLLTDFIGPFPHWQEKSPSHYGESSIQPAEYIWRNGLDFFQGNIIKYVTRHKHKGGKGDIEKAIHYLEMILENEYSKEIETPQGPNDNDTSGPSNGDTAVYGVQTNGVEFERSGCSTNRGVKGSKED